MLLRLSSELPKFSPMAFVCNWFRETGFTSRFIRTMTTNSGKFFLLGLTYCYQIYDCKWVFLNFRSHPFFSQHLPKTRRYTAQNSRQNYCYLAVWLMFVENYKKTYCFLFQAKYSRGKQRKKLTWPRDHI